MIYQELKIMNLIKTLETKIPIRRESREFGTKKKKILFGKKIKKTKEINKKKEKKLIRNGKRKPNSVFQKLDRYKMMIK